MMLVIDYGYATAFPSFRSRKDALPERRGAHVG